MSAPRGKMCSSFQKKTKTKVPQIQGTKPSSSNQQLLISTGIPSLDNIIGGGLAVGTVLLVEEDGHSTYGKPILKYFLAEGAVCGHELFVSSADVQPQHLLQELPAPILQDDGSKQTAKPEEDSPPSSVTCQSSTPQTQCCAGDSQCSGQDEELRIAWRYRNLRLPATEAGSQFGHYYDTSQTMPPLLLESIKTTIFDPLQDYRSQSSASEPLAANHCYTSLLQTIQKTVTSGQYATNCSNDQQNILRIGVHMLGSPLWGKEGLTKEPSLSEETVGTMGLSLCQFLYALRSILRSAFAVCLVTVPAHLYQARHRSQVEHLADTVIRLESFAGTELQREAMLKDYNGFLHVVKLPHLNALTSARIDTADLAFKQRRKRFTIEKLHLPPDVEDTSSSPAVDNSERLLTSAPTMGCNTALQTTLDF